MKSAGKISVLWLCAASLGWGQNVSSSLRANIVDPSGATVSGAECLLTNQGTGAVVTIKSDAQGSCIFNVLPGGSYNIAVKATGFKTLESKDIAVTAGQVRTLGDLTLEVGAITESVEVMGEVSLMQLATGERSGTITGDQLLNIAVRGRDMFALLATIPGVVDNGSQARETSSPDSIRGTFINGARENAKNYAVDGITDLDTGSNSTVHFEPNMDAIAEVKVLTSNYQAEYGRNTGGVITIITRGGSRDFHATAYDTYRHESLNANSFFNNRTGTAKVPYRYRMTGYTVGGPVFIPKLFNRDRDKVFFFWSQEYTGQRKDYGTRFVTMPTEAERNGDFSASLDGNGNLIKIYDPLTNGTQQFPGNIIPKNRFNTLGLAMLNFFPKPNYNCAGCPSDAPTDPLRFQRNYRSSYAGSYPKREDLIRVDYNITPSLQVYWRYVQDKDQQNTPYGMWVNGGINYALTPTVFGQPGHGHVAHVTKTFSPTLVNEFIFGRSHNNLYFYPQDASLMDRSKVGNPAEWFKDSGTGVSYVSSTNYMPNITFGGPHSNPVVATWGNIPYENFNDIYSIVDNISKVMGAHNLKGGMYLERTRKFQVGGRNPRGDFNFGTNANNIFDSKDGFSNALLGVINTYSEGTARVNGDWRFTNLEFYIQDNWRVSKRLTLDLGLRLYHVPPQTDVNQTIATFDPRLFSVASIPVMFRPALDANNKRVAVDPRTGQLYPNPYIGLYVPNTGNIANGGAVGGVNGYPAGLYTVNAIYWGPRLGFAYDVFGNGRTAVRGGIGMFQDRMQGNPTMNTNGNPPVSYAPTLYFGDLNTYANSGGLIGPSSLSALLGQSNPATTMNWSLSIQQQIQSFAIDVSYVGSASYHLLAQRNINPIPIGARFNPANFDASQGANKPLADNYLRPYLGWADINLVSNGYNANYNSLQTSLNRRFSRGLQLGIAYTYSKTLGVADGDTSGISPYFPPKSRNYGRLGFDRPHWFVANYFYDLPKLGKKMNVRPAEWVLDNWQISGIWAMTSGSPFTPGLGWTTSTEVTGSTEGARVNIVGSCEGQKTFYSWFNTAMVAPPAIGQPGNPNVTMANFGNAGVNVCRNPGANNWDIALAKRFPLFREGRYVQFRTELFNAWNHTQYSGLDTGTSYNPTTLVQTSQTFGRVTGARGPRNIELSLRIVF
jgi:hypothetical protein